jgi:hypothetical protein
MGMVNCVCETERPKPLVDLDAKIGLFEFAFPNGYEDDATIDYFIKNWEIKTEVSQSLLLLFFI